MVPEDHGKITILWHVHAVVVGLVPLLAFS
jgi:hypothetical protein